MALRMPDAVQVLAARLAARARPCSDGALLVALSERHPLARPRTEPPSGQRPVRPSRSAGDARTAQ